VTERQAIHGLVWTVDAVRFSRRDLVEQVEVIEFLSGEAMKIAGFGTLEIDYIVHSTGDGFIVTLIDREGLAWKPARSWSPEQPLQPPGPTSGGAGGGSVRLR
jgi:hypothetical protein